MTQEPIWVVGIRDMSSVLRRFSDNTGVCCKCSGRKEVWEHNIACDLGTKNPEEAVLADLGQPEGKQSEERRGEGGRRRKEGRKEGEREQHS